ncbi:MAG: hypothetical protein V7L19_06170 [Nostoc sp.]
MRLLYTIAQISSDGLKNTDAITMKNPNLRLIAIAIFPLQKILSNSTHPSCRCCDRKTTTHSSNQPNKPATVRLKSLANSGTGKRVPGSS